MKHILVILGLLWALGASGQIYINSYAFGAAPAGGLLLDDYPAQAAYSLRKLRTAYTGNCLVVQKASNNDTLAIGWDGNYIDTTAIATFCTSTTCHVRRWYDQSGNTRDVTQVTLANMPVIFQSGAIVVRSSADNSKKAIVSLGDFMRASFTRNQPHTVMFVGTIIANQTALDGFSSGLSAANMASLANVSSQTRIGSTTSGSFTGLFVNVNPVNYVLISALWNGASSQGIVNTTTSTGTLGTDAAAGVTLFSAANGAAGNTGFTQEVIIWTSNNTSDWANIRSNINSFYTIY